MVLGGRTQGLERQGRLKGIFSQNVSGLESSSTFFWEVSCDGARYDL